MEVGLGSGDLVLDEDQAPFPKKGAEPPNFRPMSIVAKRLDGSRWYLAWRWASVQVTLCEMGTQLPHKKMGTRAPPIFGPCLLWPRSPISSTAELLLNFHISETRKYTVSQKRPTFDLL